MNGQILILCRRLADGEVLAKWTSEWLDQEIPAHEANIFLCPSLDLAEHSLNHPLKDGTLPSLLILEHDENDREMAEFSEKLRECLPEIWVVDIVGRDSKFPVGNPHLILHKPLRRDDWEDTLSSLFFKDSNPVSFKANNPDR